MTCTLAGYCSSTLDVANASLEDTAAWFLLSYCIFGTLVDAAICDAGGAQDLVHCAGNTDAGEKHAQGCHIDQPCQPLLAS